MKYAMRLFTLLACIGTMSLAANDAPKGSSGKLLTLDEAVSHYENPRLVHPDGALLKHKDDLHYDAFHLLSNNVALKVRRDPSIVNKVNELGDTPLHILARNHPDNVYGTRYSNGRFSSMHDILVYVEYAECVRNTCRALVSAGVDLTKKNIYGLTALETAQLHKGFNNNMDSVVIDFLSCAEKWNKYPLLLQKALMKIGWL